MEFLKKHIGPQWYPNQYYGSPPSLSGIHHGYGNHLILKTEIHPCRHPFTHRI